MVTIPATTIDTHHQALDKVHTATGWEDIVWDQRVFQKVYLDKMVFWGRDQVWAHRVNTVIHATNKDYHLDLEVDHLDLVDPHTPGRDRRSPGALGQDATAGTACPLTVSLQLLLHPN